MTNIFTLYSSSRQFGNTYNMVQILNDLMPTDIWYLDDFNVQQYDYEHKNQNDDFESIINRMLEADVIIFASPVYWYSMTPAMKRFFDRFTDLLELTNMKDKGKALRQKSFYLFLTSVHDHAPRSFIDTVKNTLKYLGWQYSGSHHIKCDGALNPSDTIKQLNKFVKQLHKCKWFTQGLGQQSEMLSRFK